MREADPDRYWASLFAPADKRPHLYALYAFNFEIARVRESVREALVGEIRLQWWRDALQGEARGDVRANPIAAALDDTIVQFRLPRQSLVDLIDARIFDLYDDPMPSLNDLEGYCGETSSSLIQLSSPHPRRRHRIPARRMPPVMRASPMRSRGCCAPSRIMRDRGRSTFRPIFWPVMASCAKTSSPGAAGRASRARSPICAPSPAGICEQARTLRATIPDAAKPAFRPLALVEPYLKAMERRDYDPFHTVVDLPQWRRVGALWRGPF